MLLSVPTLIKLELQEISTAWIQIEKAENSTPGIPRRGVADFVLIPFDYINAYDVDISKHYAFFKNIEDEHSILKQIKFKVVYKDHSVKYFLAKKKTDNKNLDQPLPNAGLHVKHKISNVYEDTHEGRLMCLNDLEKKIKNTLHLNDSSIGKKNLIYYTVYFDKGYTDLLNLSIHSILEHSKINFDVMIITDKLTQKIIKKLPFTKKIKPLFHITETPTDGVEASKNKTQICNFNKLKNYNKILFLDCDIMCVKDINFIFNKEYNSRYLYAARPLDIDYGAHTRIYHGFTFLGTEFATKMGQYKQYPFNAGQFLFINTEQMQQHFKNINWFMDVWSGEYFFEQAFMCQYFGRALACGQNELDDHVTLINTTNDMKHILNENTHLIHFIAPPLDAQKKIEFIKNYLNKIKK